MVLWVFALLGTVTVGAAAAEAPVLKELSATGSAEMLRNAGFENAEGDQAAAWGPYGDGYRRVAAEGRQGSSAILCENATAEGRAGAQQGVILNRTRPAPLLVTGWSKAENVSGTSNPSYSLYVDLTYADGTPLWGQSYAFATGTHDWERAEILIVPEKPIASLNIHCLFREHSGRVWFDDISIREMDPGEHGTVFDGRPVEPGSLPRAGRSRTLSTRNGLSLRYDEQSGRVAGLSLNRRALSVRSAPGGFLVRDVAAGPAVHAFTAGRCAPLGLSLTAQATAKEDHLVIEGTVRDETGKDRAITLFFAVPFPRQGGTWHDDARRAQKLVAGDYMTTSSIGAGATGSMSRYPWACVTGPAGGLALGIDMDKPAQYRLFYNADLQVLVLAYDLALVPDTKQFPSAAPFRFVVYPVDSDWGFRSAAERYQRIFPEFYTVRSKEQGIWMPFTDVSTVQGWEDFGFRYHEGNNNVPFDDQANVLSFVYTEPSTYWMPMPKEMPRTIEAALAELKRLAAEGNPTQKQWATAALSALIYDREGRPQVQFLDTPWCDGAVWSLCCLPGIPSEPNAATLHWNEEVRKSRYSPEANGVLDGEYLDSLEGYVTADLNYRREHFAAVQAPLTFDTRTRQPAIHKSLAVWEFTRYMAADVHRMGKLMFANSVPYRFSFLTGYLDVMGTETDWLYTGKWQPLDDATLLQFRTLSGAKPYLFLMNTDYDKLVPELVERYFLRCLFYGMYPSMFSHNASENPYWGKPEWYNRDRALFKRYIPVIRRVGEAGWQPVAQARCENAYVERFGPGEDGATFLTLLNPTDQALDAELRLEPGLPAAALVDILSGERFPVTNGRARVPLGADGVRPLEVKRAE